MGCEIRRIIQFSSAMRFGEVKIIDSNGADVTASCSFAWSADSVCWTNWVSYPEYLRIAPHLDTDFFLRVRISCGLSKVFYGELPTDCYSITLEQSNIFLSDPCSSPNLLNPYAGLDCALEMQQQLADGVICMFGIPVYYIKVRPNKKTADYTFKEYVLHNVESIKQIKLMVADGEMPSSKPQFSEFDFDWETDWDVEVGKSQFAAAFGDTAFPAQGDFIYIPMMKRMWSINSAYDEKKDGLMWRSVTWKLGLVKYVDSSNIDNNRFEDVITEWVGRTYENTFGELEKIEQDRESGTPSLSSPRYAADTTIDLTMSDAIRRSISKSGITIEKAQYNHHNTIVAKNRYIMEKDDAQVTYQARVCGESGTLSIIISTPEKLPNCNIIECGAVRLDLKDNKLIFNGLETEIEPSSDYMAVLVWNRDSAVSQLNVYKYTHEENVPRYALRPFMYYFDFDNGVELTAEYNNDFNMKEGHDVMLRGAGLRISNIKLFNKALDHKQIITECCRWATDSKICVINDIVRPIDSGLGFAVK